MNRREIIAGAAALAVTPLLPASSMAGGVSGVRVYEEFTGTQPDDVGLVFVSEQDMPTLDLVRSVREAFPSFTIDTPKIAIVAADQQMEDGFRSIPSFVDASDYGSIPKFHEKEIGAVGKYDVRVWQNVKRGTVWLPDGFRIRGRVIGPKMHALVLVKAA